MKGIYGGIIGMAILTINLGMQGEVEPTVAKYLNNKEGAFSFTFDDGFRHQVENTLEIIEPLGIRGTFFLIPYYMEDPERSWNMVKWERVKEMEARGHEIGTHGSIQVKLHEAPEDILEAQINGSWQLLKERTGAGPVTYAAPGGSKIDERVEAKIREHHYFVRNGRLLPDARIMGYGRTEHRKWEDGETRERILASMKAGEWVIPFVHAIVDGYSPFKSKEEFRDHCEWLKSIEDRLWIAPMGTVGRYVFEREAAELEVLGQSEESMTLRLTHHLENKEVFNAPLTVIIPVIGAKEGTVKQGKNGEATIEVRAEHILVNLLPNGVEATIRWKLASEADEE